MKRREEWRYQRPHLEAALVRLGITKSVEELAEEFAASAKWHHWTGVTPNEDADWWQRRPEPAAA